MWDKKQNDLLDRKINHKLHKIATAFEAFIGYLYLYDKKRLNEIFELLNESITVK